MYPEITVNLGNLLLSLSDALDQASSRLASHQQRTAFITWELCRAAGLDAKRTEDAFLAALLHDIGALSVEEKVGLHACEVEDALTHCRLGEILFQDNPWLRPAAGIVRHHHTPWHELGGSLDDGRALESQILLLADLLERAIDRDRFILHQDEVLSDHVVSQSGSVLHEDVVALFMSQKRREEFWLDIVSPRLYSLLLHNGPLRRIEVDLKEIPTVTRLFKNIIDFKSPFTATHSSGVAQCAKSLTELFGLTSVETRCMEIAGHLHDLGKLAVPNAILDKPGKLTKDEFAVIRQHTYFTFTVLVTIQGLNPLAEWAAYHHERLDGNGYPFKKDERELSIGARIMAVADVFTALAEDRPYREGMGEDRILRILSDMSTGGALDPKIVQCLHDNIADVRTVVKGAQAEALEYYENNFRI